jgi:hypothetical protein
MKERWTVAASLWAAFASSFCCTLPLAAAGLGLGAASLASVLEPWRPLLIVVVAASPGQGLLQRLQAAARVAAIIRRSARSRLWATAAVALSLLGVPYVTGSAVRATQRTERWSTTSKA